MYGSIVPTPHLQSIMNPQDYMQSRLNDLLQLQGLAQPSEDEQFIQDIIRLTLSKKFRKYSIGPEPLEHLKASVRANVKNREPIKFTLPFGAYKLWRLDETPEADWGELFTLMYFTNWLKPICEIYEPGVWFDFFSDDVIIPRINNIPAEDLEAYNKSFHMLLDFMQAYQPKNFNMTLTRVIDQYDNQADFEAELEQQTTKLTTELDGGLPVLDDAQKATIELNVKTTPEQEDDPQWREKIQLMHDSYASVSKRRPYYRPIEKHKIMVVTTPLWGMLTVGSTKDSTMKFWVGAGVLKPKDNSFRQIILSPTQLEKAHCDFEDVNIGGLLGKNFNRIRILR
jgi:hypothetical protein